ncbi:MAG: hypothetical protein R6U62_01020, partial [Bacteroidales bacterium]
AEHGPGAFHGLVNHRGHFGAVVLGSKYHGTHQGVFPISELNMHGTGEAAPAFELAHSISGAPERSLGLVLASRPGVVALRGNVQVNLLR